MSAQAGSTQTCGGGLQDRPFPLRYLRVRATACLISGEIRLSLQSCSRSRPSFQLLDAMSQAAHQPGALANESSVQCLTHIGEGIIHRAIQDLKDPVRCLTQPHPSGWGCASSKDFQVAGIAVHQCSYGRMPWNNGARLLGPTQRAGQSMR